MQEQVAAAAADAAVPAKDAEQQQPKPFSVKEGMQGIVSLLEKSVKTKETRLLMGRLMRQTAMVRKHMTASDLARFVKTYLPQDSSSAGFLQGHLKQVGWGRDANNKNVKRDLQMRIALHCATAHSCWQAVLVVRVSSSCGACTQI